MTVTSEISVVIGGAAAHSGAVDTSSITHKTAALVPLQIKESADREELDVRSANVQTLRNTNATVAKKIMTVLQIKYPLKKQTFGTYHSHTSITHALQTMFMTSLRRGAGIRNDSNPISFLNQPKS
jgi:V8-like Glu-specific endopeptidase